jgi:ribosome-associated heat shock protein Hsp15
MRLDKFLFFVRLLKSRTLAQGLIGEGRTRIDGRRVERASECIRIGSTVTLPLRGDVRVIRVLALPTRRGPAPEARACYEELGVDGNSAPA